MGFFHEIDYGRPSLALDLMEEWRPLIADSMVLMLVNRGSLKPANFHWTGAPKRPVELGRDGTSAVFQAYGEWLERRVYHEDAGPGGETTLRHAILLQARRVAQTIQEKRVAYVSFMVK